eukprot:TRINITY_DN321_c0_g2_i1.p3 TRINITY_DN321_c0_g2~~TRINITY_DN321_c0_g2_i1.p3  ORF type:complete len:132 (+),score=12.10 TRINITY_DN321_c0_g2_i1:275-670(+)
MNFQIATLSRSFKTGAHVFKARSTSIARPSQKGRKVAYKVVNQDSFDPKTGVRCFVNSEGHLQCEKLTPGDYVVKSVAPKEHEDEALGLMYCYVTESGELLCEGLEEGEYKLDAASPEDIQKFYDNYVANK